MIECNLCVTLKRHEKYDCLSCEKVYHWPGPATFPIEGVSPHYKPSYIPDGFMIRYIHFPTAEKLSQAVLKVGESEIGFILMGFTTGMMASNIATSNQEDLAYLKRFTDSVQGPGFLIIMVGNSPNDTEYKKQVLQKIMEECDGKPLEAVDDPENAGGFMWRFIRVTASIREVARADGVFGGQVGSADVFPLMHRFIAASSPLKQRLINERRILDDGNNPESIKAQMEVGMYANKMAIEGHFGVPGHVLGEQAHQQFGPHASNYHLWLKKVKKTFDPNAASDSTHYINAD